jgi:hypothetical protein
MRERYLRFRINCHRKRRRAHPGWVTPSKQKYGYFAGDVCPQETVIQPGNTTMAKTAGDVIVETLLDWGVDTIFGIPGDGINGVIESLRKNQDKIKFIQTRHEEAAAFAACGYAKVTNRLGVCLATSGPGAIHLLNGLYDAKLDGVPVLAITGLQFHDLIGTHTQQDVALDKLFMDVALYNERIMGAAHAQNITELACRTALARKGVAHITIPVDFQDQEVSDDMRSKRNKPNHVSNEFAIGARRPTTAELNEAAQILNRGKKVAILAGRGALHAGTQLEQLAETLGAPIIKSLLGKSCVPDDSPYTTGGLGLLGTLPSEEAMQECDTLLNRRLDAALHRVLSEARTSRLRANRHGSDAHCASLSGGRWPGGRRRRNAERADSAAQIERQIFPEKSAGAKKGLGRIAAHPRHRDGYADETASGRL